MVAALFGTSTSSRTTCDCCRLPAKHGIVARRRESKLQIRV